MADLTVPTTGTSFEGAVTPQAAAPSAPAPTPAAAYLQNTAQTAQSNIALAVGANPDYEAEMQRLAQQTGTPVDSVRAFPDAVKQKAAVSGIDFQNLAKQFPTTAAFYQSQNNAKIAHDDVGGLQSVERATSALGPAGNTVPLAPGTTGYFQPDNSPLPLRERMLNWGRNLLGMGDAVPTGNAQGAGSAQAFIQNYAKQNGMTVGQERDAVGGASEIPTQFAQGFENSFTAGLAPDVNGPAQTTAGGVASGAGNLAGFIAGAPLKLAGAAVEKVGGSVLEHVAGESFAKAAAKDVVGQASTLGLASAITATGDALNQSSPEAALTTIGLQGLHGAEMGGVFGAAGRMLPDATAVQTLARVVGVNAAMDAIQGSTPWDDRTTAQKVMDYGLNSVFALHGAGRATGAWLTDAARADVATGDAQTLADLATSAANSKLRPRDPQAFKDFVATANADGPVPNVYVDGATLANALNQSGVKIGDVESTMPRVAQQLPEALATGGDVSIPVEDFATHIAGGPLGDAIMPHLKTDPDGMTQQQAQEFYQSSKETFQQATEAATADKANDAAVAQSAQAVHDNVLDQLTQANRFRPDVNKVYAALVRDSYTAAGARAGLSPEAMFERYPLRIAADDGAAANALDGESTPDNPLAKLSTSAVQQAGEVGPGRYLREGQVHPDDWKILKDAGLVHDFENPDGTTSPGVDGGALGAERDRRFATEKANRKPVSNEEKARGVDRRADNYARVAKEQEDLGEIGNAETAKEMRAKEAELRAQAAQLRAAHNSLDQATDTKPEEAATGVPWAGTVLRGESGAKRSDGSQTDAGDFGKGRYFTGDRSRAEAYARGPLGAQTEGGKVHEERISLQNPLVFKTATEAREYRKSVAGKDLVDKPQSEEAARMIDADLREKGHDGVVVYDSEGNYTAHPELPFEVVHLGNEVNQEARGKLSFSDDLTSAPSTITLNKDADLSTFVHELGHFHLEMLSHMAKDGSLPEVSKDFDTALQWLRPKEAPIAQFKRDAAAIESRLPKTADGFVRMWRGNRPGEVGQATTFTNDLPGIGLPFRKSYGGDLSYVDIPAADAAKYEQKEGTAAGAEFNLPAEIAAKATVVDGHEETAADRAAAWRAMPLEEKRPMHEQFARGFEAYLFEGKAPTPELQGVFQRVRAWMINVYRSLQNLHVQLSPEVRGVFDRLLATNDAIRGAEAERAYTPMFATAEEAGMTPEEFQAYHALGNEATLEASDELTARTLRDMRFTEIAKDRASKEVRADVAAKRAAVREQVIEDVAKEPAYAAQDFMLGQANKEHQIPADLVAERFGFANADEMTKAIADAEPRREVVEALTDQRMLEKYGDITSPQAMNAAANEAIHNEVRTRFIATEYKALTKATGGVRVLEKAAKAVAETTIAKARVRDINASKYGAAEARAGKAADAARLKGDLTEAAQQKRNQLLNNQLEKTARAAAAEVLKSLQYLKKFNKESARGKIDVDVRDQIDDMLARFDLRTNPVDAPTRQQINLEKWVESQIDAGYAPNVSPDMLNPTFRTPYRDMTMEQFRGLTDAVKSLEKIGRDRKTATINGEKQDIAQYVAEHLIPKMQARGDQFSDAEIFDKPADRSNNPFKIALDHLTSQLRAIKAQLKPQEYKRNQYDMHELLGPFGEAIYEPVFRANYHEVDMLKGMSDDFQKMADHLGREWQDSLTEGVTNTKLMDVNIGSNAGTPTPYRMNRGKMLGIAIHVGNESNFDKLTQGWKWNPQDVWSFLHDNMTEKDWKAVQSVWDQYDKHWPDMAAMNQRLGNTSPERIEPRAFPTKFGEMRGGYAAIKYDPLRSRRGQIEAAGRAIDPSKGLFGSSFYRADTTTNGSLNARNHGYTDVVDLDFHTIPRAMTESIHDLAYREALIDVNKIIEQGDFRRQFQKTYGPEAYRSLQEWLGKTANADNQDREIGALGKVLQWSRTGLVINGIAFRISTVLKHGGSAAIKTTGYFTGGGEKFLAARFAAMGTNYAAEIRGAQEKFPEIRARLLQQDRDFRAMSANLFEPESKRGKAERFGHAAVAWSDMMTAVPTAWAAYDRAVTVGVPKNMGGTGEPMTEEQAVAYASKIVREAHGSNITTARSMVINNSSEAVKMFTTLYGFMNNTYGQAADIADKLKTAGISNPQTLARGFMALIVPAIWAGYLTEGPPNDKDGWAHWIAKSIGTEVAGMVPFVRDAAMMVEGYSHAGQVGVESFLNTLVGAGKDVYHLATGQHVNAPIKDIANAAGMGLHIPGLGQLGGSAQYLADVASGKQHPQGPLDVAEGVAMGRAPKH